MKLRSREANPKVTELRSLPLFASLGTKQLRTLAMNFDEVTVKPGEKILSAGHHNDTFWLILEGEVDLTIGDRVHESRGRGELFGLPSMFTGRDSAADVVARTSLRALVASHQQFSGLTGDPEVEMRFKAAMFDHLREEVYQLAQLQRRTPAAARSATKKPAATKRPADTKKPS